MNDRKLVMLAALPGLVKSRDAIVEEIAEIRSLDGRFNNADDIASLPGLFLSRDQLNDTINEIQHANGTQPRPGSIFAKRHAIPLVTVEATNDQRDNWHRQIAGPKKLGRPKGGHNKPKVPVETPLPEPPPPPPLAAKRGTYRTPIGAAGAVDKAFVSVVEALQITGFKAEKLRRLADNKQLGRLYKANKAGGHPTPYYRKSQLEELKMGWDEAPTPEPAPTPEKKKPQFSKAGINKLSKAATTRWKLRKKSGLPNSHLMTNEQLMAAINSKPASEATN